MNERIKELYTQIVGDDKLNFDSYLAEKFALLIVRKCVSALDEADGSVHHRECLFEHFGVEDFAPELLGSNNKADIIKNW